MFCIESVVTKPDQVICLDPVKAFLVISDKRSWGAYENENKNENAKQSYRLLSSFGRGFL